MNRYYDVSQFKTAELERAKRELKANLCLITSHSPAHVPIQAQIEAIDAELAEGCVFLRGVSCRVVSVMR